MAGFYYHSILYESIKGTALEPEISKGGKALHKTHLSLTQLGDRRNATHPPPVRGINFKQDARHKSKTNPAPLLFH